MSQSKRSRRTARLNLNAILATKLTMSISIDGSKVHNTLQGSRSLSPLQKNSDRASTNIVGRHERHNKNSKIRQKKNQMEIITQTNLRLKVLAVTAPRSWKRKR